MMKKVFAPVPCGDTELAAANKKTGRVLHGPFKYKNDEVKLKLETYAWLAAVLPSAA